MNLSPLDQIGGFFKGAVEVGSETVNGLADLAEGAGSTLYDTVGGAAVDSGIGAYELLTGDDVDKADWLPDLERGVDRIETAGEIVGTIVDDPGMLVDAIVDPIREDWQAGRYGEAIGRGAAEVLLTVVGTKGADKAAKAGRVADTLGDAARLTDDLATLPRFADDLGDAGRVADDLGDVGHLGDNLTDLGRAADDVPLVNRLPEFSDGARHIDDITGVTVIDARRGGTGNWSRQLDQAIEPDVIYRTDNAYLYHTDDSARVTRVEGDLQLDFDQPRWSHRQSTVTRDHGVKGPGVVDPDQGGHLIARMFGGPGESINLVPMKGSVNQGTFGVMETEIRELLEAGNRVQADIRLHYPDEGLMRRPDRLDVELTITRPDGTVNARSYPFDNSRP